MPAKKRDTGHAAHTQTSDAQAGLPGRFHRPIRVVMLGAGSFFTSHLFGDFLLMPGLPGLEFVLVDTDTRRLSVMHQLCSRMLTESGAGDRVKLVSSTDRRRALPGAHFIICCVEVAGLACVRHDYDIPRKYGVDQCIGDTMGPGGLFKALRTIPTILDILRDCERLCPEALFLNYTNPMGAICAAAGRQSAMRLVGLCHSVQGTSHQLANWAGVPYDEMQWECAGINHLAWFTTLRHRGRDLYPRLRKRFARELAERRVPDEAEEFWDFVRKDMMLHFGAFITESSGHLSEYLPYYRKRPDLVKKYCVPRYGGEAGFYARNWPKWRANSDRDRLRMIRQKQPLQWSRSWEYASWIAEAAEKDSPIRIHGNVMNSHRGAGPLIANLPHNGCVEVACMVDANGVSPVAYGTLPPQMAALCASNMAFISMTADAAIHRSMEAAVHALMLDPLTAACCSPAEIARMAGEMFKAQKPYLPGFK